MARYGPVFAINTTKIYCIQSVSLANQTSYIEYILLETALLDQLCLVTVHLSYH